MARRSKLTVCTWFYSRWSEWEECPLKFRLRRLEKRPEPPSPAAERGTAIHAAAEDALRVPAPTRPVDALSAPAPRPAVELQPIPVPRELELFAAELMGLRTVNAIPEEPWVLDRAWRPVPVRTRADGGFETDWTRAWLLLKIDAHALRPDRTLEIVDFKSGRVRDSYLRQTELYALAGFAVYDVDVVRTSLWFTDHGERIDADYALREAEVLAARWDARVEGMFSDATFAPRPGAYCRWCAFARSKGGPCAFG